MLEKARFYFGTFLTGLNIGKCDYNTFENWYNETHEENANLDIYNVAVFVWDNFCKR